MTTTQDASAGPGARPSGFVPAGRSASAWTLLGFASLLALVTDLATKYLAFQNLAGFPVILRREDVLALTPRLGELIPAHAPTVVVPHVLELTLVLNPGAVFGVGAGKRWFFVVFTLAALSFALYAFASWTRARDRLLHVAIAMVVGGGLGNLYDRLTYACVRDFLHPLPGVKLPFGWSWPWGGREVWPYVSNLADAYLIVGVLVLAFWAARNPAPQPGAQQG